MKQLWLLHHCVLPLQNLTFSWCLWAASTADLWRCTVTSTDSICQREEEWAHLILPRASPHKQLWVKSQIAHGDYSSLPCINLKRNLTSLEENFQEIDASFCKNMPAMLPKLLWHQSLLLCISICTKARTKQRSGHGHSWEHAMPQVTNQGHY